MIESLITKAALIRCIMASTADLDLAIMSKLLAKQKFALSGKISCIEFEFVHPLLTYPMLVKEKKSESISSPLSLTPGIVLY